MAKNTALPKGITLKINGSFSVAVMVKGVRKSGTAKTLAEAVALREALIASIETGLEAPKPQASSAWTFQTAIKQTQALVWSLKNNPKAQVYAKDVAKFFGPDTRLDRIWGPEVKTKPSISLVDKYVERCKERGNSGSTINRKLTALSVMLKTAMSRNEAGELPFVPKMPRQPEGEHRVRYLTQDEEDRLLALMSHMGYVEFKEATIILVDTGMRPSELWTAESRDVYADPAGENLYITMWKTKTKTPRTLPLTSRSREIVERRAAAYPTGKLFPDMTQDRYRHVWDKVKHLMGLDNDDQFVPYVLRHTCCSRMVQDGIHQMHVQDWMGHSAIATTRKYTHIAPKNLLVARDSLERRTA